MTPPSLEPSTSTGRSTRSGSPCRTTPVTTSDTPEQVWAPAYDNVDAVRPGADVAELLDLLTWWLPGMRVVVWTDDPTRRPAALRRCLRLPDHSVRQPPPPGSILDELEPAYEQERIDLKRLRGRLALRNDDVKGAWPPLEKATGRQGRTARLATDLASVACTK